MGPAGLLTAAKDFTKKGSSGMTKVLGALAAFVTFITFLAKSIYRVKPGEQGLMVRGKHIVRVRSTRPIAYTFQRRYGFFGPIRRDELGYPMMRPARFLWIKRRIKPPEDATQEEQLDPYYGEFKVLGPNLYFVLWPLGEIVKFNTQDNPDSTIDIPIEVIDEDGEDEQRDVKAGLVWGVKHSYLDDPIPPIARAFVYGVNGLQRLVELCVGNALLELFESSGFDIWQPSKETFEQVEPKVREELDEYGVNLRKIKILGRAKSLGEKVKTHRPSSKPTPESEANEHSSGSRPHLVAGVVSQR